MSLPSRLLGANPSIQVSTLLSGSLTTPSAKGAFSTGSYDLIDTFTATDNTTTAVTFSSIPQTYVHLELRIAARSLATIGAGTSIQMTWNNDNSANYTFHSFLGAASTGANNTNRGTAQTVAYCGVVEGNAANALASSVITIMNYSSSSKVKTQRTFAGQCWTTTTGYAFMNESGLYNGTSAITSIKLDVGGVNAFYAGSIFSLYGIKGA